MNPVAVVAVVTCSAVVGTVAAVVALMRLTEAWGAVVDRRWRRRADFTGAPTHTLLVPAGPDGRPGETLLAPSAARYIGKLHKTGVRRDFEVMLGRNSKMWVECLPLPDVGPRPGATDLLVDVSSTSYLPMFARPVTAPTAAQFLGKEAVMFGYTNRRGHVCTEWRFRHNGWLFAAGVENPGADASQVAALANAVLRTWRWLDGPSTIVRKSAPDAGAKVTLIRPQDA